MEDVDTVSMNDRPEKFNGTLNKLIMDNNGGCFYDIVDN